MLRISIMLDENLEKKLRVLQAKLIFKSKKSVSFSRVINEVLDDALKKRKAKHGT